MSLTISQHAAAVKSQFGHILNGRIEAGQQLALTGKVAQVDPNTWNVGSQSEPGKLYLVTWTGAWSCDCPDWTGAGYHPAPCIAYGGATQPVCKHVLAASLIYFSGEQPAPVVADLCIATKRAPFISAPDGRILWIKKAGCDRAEPKAEKYLTDSDIAARLAKYQLIGTEARATEVIRRYVLAGAA
jgi:hypothetical protein